MNTNTTTDRRREPRLHEELRCEVHRQKDRRAARVLDVSRHGVFVAMQDPPAERQVLLLTVHLPGGPFEALATVARRVDADPHFGGAPGVGLKLSCLSSEAKERWDCYVDGAINAIELPVRQQGSTSATFILQPEDLAVLKRFFEERVRSRRTLWVMPAVRALGARIDVVLVHPRTREELAFKAMVVELNADRPGRMGVRFEQLTPLQRHTAGTFFRDAWAPTEPAAQPESAAADWSEYAFFSPRISGGTEFDVAPNGDLRRATSVSTPFAELQTSLPITEPGLDGAPMNEDELDVVVGELLARPELAELDRERLFDFNWNAELSQDTEKH